MSIPIEIKLSARLNIGKFQKLKKSMTWFLTIRSMRLPRAPERMRPSAIFSSFCVFGFLISFSKKRIIRTERGMMMNGDTGIEKAMPVFFTVSSLKKLVIGIVFSRKVASYLVI